jgi:hypothetical protein
VGPCASALAASTASSAEAGEVHTDSLRRELTPEEVAERTDFLIQSLESRQKYGTRWHRSWVGIYSIGIVVEGARAGFTDHRGARADYLISASKSAIALVELYVRPIKERFGADPILAMPDVTEEDRLRRLDAAEKLLEENAARDHSRYGWLPHLANVLLNATGGGILLAIDEPERAAISTAVGVVFGELFIWTQPKGADADLHAYRERFGDAEASHWSFGVMPGGLALR